MKAALMSTACQMTQCELPSDKKQITFEDLITTVKKRKMKNGMDTLEPTTMPLASYKVPP